MNKRVLTDHAAKDRWKRILQQSLSCVSTTAHLFTAPPESGPDEHVALGCHDDPVRLRTGSGGTLHIRFSQLGVPAPNPRADGERKIKTLKYSYAVMDPNDADHELIAWHWHPDAGHPLAHMHTELVRQPKSKLHIPTGRVSFEDVLIFLINEFDVELAKGKKGTGSAILAKNNGLFVEHRTWSGAGPPN